LGALQVDLLEFLPESVEIVEDHPVLNDDVRVVHLVEVTCVIAIYAAGINAFVDPQ